MGELIRDEARWAYPGFSGVAHRRLRVWRLDERTVMAVLTERRSDIGTSVTDCARDIVLRLEREYPSDLVRVLEHYPDNEPGRRYSEVHLDGGVQPVWAHVSDQAARGLLPGLEGDETAGQGPVEVVPGVDTETESC